jgi:hypothetical protein
MIQSVSFVILLQLKSSEGGVGSSLWNGCVGKQKHNNGIHRRDDRLDLLRYVNYAKSHHPKSATPSPSEQVRIIKSLESSARIEVGSVASLIADSWVKSWRLYVGYGGLARPPSPCGPISNSPLLKDGELDWRSKIEKSDFHVIPPALWEAYFGWYGGGPVLAFPVVQGKAGPVAAYKRIDFKIRYKGETTSLSILKAVRVSELHAEARELCSVPPDAQTRLIDFWDTAFRAEVEDSKYIESYPFYQNQLFVLDHRENGEWATQPPPPTVPILRYSSIFPDRSANAHQITARRDRQTARADQIGKVDHISTRTDRVRVAAVPGAIGLVNQGNTCDLNSALQCLLRSRPLIDLFVGGN